MADTLHIRTALRARYLALLVVVLLAPASPVAAQGGSSAIGNAMLALWNGAGASGSLQTVNGRIFGAVVSAQVMNVDGDTTNLGSTDQVLRFDIRRPGGPVLLSFPVATLGTSRAAFTSWVTANSAAIVNALFPTSLSEAAAGRDIASNNAQQLLQNTILGISAPAVPGRARATETGGLFEYEHFSGDDRSGSGILGFYKTRWQVSFLGRYAQQHENETPITPSIPVNETSTKSFDFAADYHPSRLLDEDLDWRVGADAHAGLFFANATTMDFGSVDVGGGGWTSAHRDFSRLRIGGGALLGVTKSHFPVSFLPNSDDVKALADAFNNRDVEWDASYGGVAGYALNDKTSLNGKFLQTVPIESGLVARPTLTTFMASVSYLVGGLTPIDVGYKHSAGGGVGSHSIFLQGNFSF